MPGKLDWGDTQNIAILLANKFPEIDPLGASFTLLQKWITELEGFGGNPRGSNPVQLEEIRMTWHGKYNERHWDAGSWH